MSVGVLRNLRLNSAELLSVVDTGASGNDRHRPRIVLIKRDAEKAMTLEEVLASLPEDQRAVIAAALAEAAAKEEPEEKPEEKADEEKPEEEKIARDKLPEPVRKALEKAEADAAERDKEAKELRKRVEAMESEKELTELTKRAKDSMNFVPGAKTEDLGKMLQVAKRSMSAAQFEQLEKVLKSSSAAIAKGKLFEELGSDREGGDDAESQLRALAKSLREKDPEMSESKAVLKAAEMRPDLYAQRQAEIHPH